MMHCIPVRHFFSTLLFAAAALPAHAATVAEAVSAARATDPVDVDRIVAHPDGVLDAVGGGGTEGLDDVQSLWADGKGTLAGSAQASVIECRGKTDTTCRAIQVLDRGFPERPSIGEDILAGRDEIVENPTTAPNAGDETCRDVSIETPEVETTETCRAGGWWTETACRIGPVEIGKVTAKHFACAEGEGKTEVRTCLSQMSGTPSSSVWTQRCFFGQEAGKPEGTVKTETSAVAKAVFTGTCTSTDASSETVKCSEVLESNNDHGCVLGAKTTGRVTGDSILQHDGCSDGDVLLAQHTCGKANLVMQVKGFPSLAVSPSNASSGIPHRTNSHCRADYGWKSVDCAGPTCTAKLWARVYYDKNLMGIMNLTFTYTNESYYLKDVWVDHCASIRGKVAASSAEAGS